MSIKATPSTTATSILAASRAASHAAGPAGPAGVPRRAMLVGERGTAWLAQFIRSGAG